MRVKGSTLTFEFQKKDTVLEVYKSDLMTVEIPFTDLQMVEFKKGLFSTKLILHASNARALKDIPGNELVSRTLKVKKKDKEIAANISSKVNLELSEMKLRELED